MHKSLLIDSDVLIDHLRKETDALAFLSGEIERGSLLFMSVVSRTEIIAGMRKRRGAQKVQQELIEKFRNSASLGEHQFAILFCIIALLLFCNVRGIQAAGYGPDKRSSKPEVQSWPPALYFMGVI